MDLGIKFLLYLIKRLTVIPSDEIDGNTQMTESTGSADTMKIRLSVLGKVKIDDDVDSLNVDATSEEIRAYKVATFAVAEIVKNSITRLLEHACVRVEAGVSELGNFFGKKLHTIRGIAEDDGLVDL